LESILADPVFARVNFDISWDEVAKYVVASPEATRRTADLINRYPDRFLFGTDTVAPKSAEAYYAPYEMYRPLWNQLTAEAREGILKRNYERIFDEGRRNARAWERAHPAGTGAPRAGR
ncbi:MAG TPA: amidohydrolase, partial [Candidatus Eisenbacteria bacterium]|nr:amidohydrolase [Candidatus Eisenbacteria bacterium]